MNQLNPAQAKFIPLTIAFLASLPVGCSRSKTVEPVTTNEATQTVKTSLGIEKTEEQRRGEDQNDLLAAAHILVQHNGSQWKERSVTRTREEAERRIADIHAKLKAGADFAALARQYSDVSTSSSGGDLGWVHKSRMPKPFVEAAKDLAVGEISGPVETEYGFHIVKKTRQRK